MLRSVLLVLVVVSLTLTVFLVTQAASGSPEQPLTSGQFVQVNEQGFGDRQNSFAWAMQWWKGKLYVGTGRSYFCVTIASTDEGGGTDL